MLFSIIQVSFFNYFLDYTRTLTYFIKKELVLKRIITLYLIILSQKKKKQ